MEIKRTYKAMKIILFPHRWHKPNNADSTTLSKQTKEKKFICIDECVSVHTSPN